MECGGSSPFNVATGFYLAGTGVSGTVPMGFCGHIGTTWADTPQDYINALSGVGATILREDIKWARVESSLGNYAFPGVDVELNRLDDAMTLAESSGISTLAILDYGNSLYGPASPVGYKGGLPLTEEERTAFSNYAVYLVNELASRDVQFELWNEWNVPLGATTAQTAAGEHEDPLKYYALQEVVYPAIKATNPNVFMWAGGFSEPNTVSITKNEWISSYLAIDGWETTTDGFSFHHYFDFTRPERWFWQVKGTTEAVRVAAKSKPNLPVAVTESGWFNGSDPQSITEARAAEFYSRWPFLLRCTGVNLATFYDLRNDGTGTTKEENFGVYNSSYVLKPAGTVLADVLPILTTVTEASYWTDGPRHVVLMDDNKLAFWTDEATTTSLDIEVQATASGNATLTVAGVSSSSVAISQGTSTLNYTLSNTAQIIELPANSIIFGFN